MCVSDESLRQRSGLRSAVCLPGCSVLVAACRRGVPRARAPLYNPGVRRPPTRDRGRAGAEAGLVWMIRAVSRLRYVMCPVSVSCLWVMSVCPVCARCVSCLSVAKGVISALVCVGYHPAPCKRSASVHLPHGGTCATHLICASMRSSVLAVLSACLFACDIIRAPAKRGVLCLMASYPSIASLRSSVLAICPVRVRHHPGPC